MIFRQTRLTAVLLIIVFLFLPVAASAQAGLPTQIVPADCNVKGGCQSICDLAKLAQNVLNFGIFLAVIMSAFLFAYAGWKLMTAGGNTEVYAQGRRIFKGVAIGLVIILGGWIVVDTLLRTLMGTTTGTGRPWSQICLEVISHFEKLYA